MPVVPKLNFAIRFLQLSQLAHVMTTVEHKYKFKKRPVSIDSGSLVVAIERPSKARNHKHFGKFQISYDIFF